MNQSTRSSSRPRSLAIGGQNPFSASNLRTANYSRRRARGRNSRTRKRVAPSPLVCRAVHGRIAFGSGCFGTERADQHGSRLHAAPPAVALRLPLAGHHRLHHPVHPGLHGARRTRASALTVAEVADRKISVGEYQRSYLRQRQMYQSMYQGRSTDELMRRLGPRGAGAAGPRRRPHPRARGGAAGDQGGRRDGEAPPRHLPRVPAGRALPRRGRDPPAARAPGHERARVRGFAPREPPPRAAHLPRHRRRAGDARGGGAGVPPPQRADQGRIRAGARSTPPACPPPTTRRGRGSRPARTRTASPSGACVQYVLVDAASMAPRVTRDGGATAARTTSRTATSSPQPAELCASHILVKVKARRTRRRDTARTRRAASRSPRSTRSRRAPTSPPWPGASSEDPAPRPRAAISAASRAGAWCRSSTNAAFALASGQMSELVRTSFGYHVIKATARKEAVDPPMARAHAAARRGGDSGAASEAMVAGEGARDGGRPRRRGAARGRGARAGASPSRRPRPSPAPTPGRRSASAAADRPRVRAREGRGGAGAAARRADGYVFVAVEEVQAPQLPELKEVQETVRADVIAREGLPEGDAPPRPT